MAPVRFAPVAKRHSAASSPKEKPTREASCCATARTVNHEVRGCQGGDAQNDPPGWEGERCTRPPSARWHVRAQRPRLPASGAAALTSPTPGLNQGNQLQTSWK
jgi:hypothetical protein